MSGALSAGAFGLAAFGLSGVAVAQTSRVSAGYFAGGSLSGTIVDTDGVPQMGALVQLLMPDTSEAATAVTDAQGRYRVADLKPGSYRVRVSAALFLPVIRQRLQMGSGSRAVWNVTLSTLLAPTPWLPATQRTGTANDDDWIWTLRASTMRPVLRAVEDDGQAPVSISSSAAEQHRLQSRGRVTMQDSEGEFARGGTHQVLSLERQNGPDSAAILHADFSGARTPYPVAPSAELSAGWERRLPIGTISRTVVTYTSHPEILGHNNGNGLQTAVFRNAERMELGDTIRVDAGSVLRALNLAGNAVALEPFLKLAFRPSNGVVIAYTYTESRGTEQLEDLDRVTPALPLATWKDGRLQLERGRHQAVSLGVGTPEHGQVEVTAYRDRVLNPVLAGTGVLTAVDSSVVSSMVDPTTQTFVVAAPDYDSTGVRLTVQQPVTSQFALMGEVADGRVLTSLGGETASLSDTLQRLSVQNGLTATLRADAHFRRTGTHVSSGYRWQANRTLTAVDSFRNAGDSAYLHCKLRQSLQRVPLLPANLEAVVDLQNLLAQGYRPFLSSDGHTLYLTQSPRVLQAGLSFTF